MYLRKKFPQSINFMVKIHPNIWFGFSHYLTTNCSPPPLYMTSSLGIYRRVGPGCAEDTQVYRCWSPLDKMVHEIPQPWSSPTALHTLNFSWIGKEPSIKCHQPPQSFFLLTPHDLIWGRAPDRIVIPPLPV